MQRILVIAPNNEPRQTIFSLLEAEGFEPLVADNGTIGIQVAHQHHPDLILCTLQLDSIDGHQVLQDLRQQPDLAVIPFILLTHHSDITHLRRSMELGADDCLVQPFSDSELISAITTRLNKQEALTERYTAVLRHAAERLNRLAHYDSLTDLPNHRLLHQRLSQAIATTTEQDAPIALLSLSLDRLRQINNSMGYPAGDSLLQAAAKRLTACLPREATVARLTGNQFAIILSHYRDRTELRQIVEDVMDTLSRPFSLPGQEVFVTTSIGITLYPDNSRDISTLLRQADAALEWAKHQKSNYYQFYRTDMPVVSDDQIVLETWLRYALERQEFQVYYQPQCNLKTGRIESAEALIRWHHPDHGFISPNTFIPLTEETGLIVPIGEWILRNACTHAQQWQNQGLLVSHISVNLSSVQFNQPDLSTKIAQLLRETELNPQQLELELTETALMQDAETAIATLNELKQLGIRIAIDDFGTGYSSLSYLKQFPIDTLKIDNCFVRGVITDAKNQAILTAVIQMAHDLELEVVAEGVETEAELQLLKAYGCDVVQGFFLGPPMNNLEMTTLLTDKKAAESIKWAS